MNLEVLIFMAGYIITRDETTGNIIPEYSGELITTFHLLQNLKGSTTSTRGYIKELNYKFLLESDQYLEKLNTGKEFSNFIRVVSDATKPANLDTTRLLIDKLKTCKSLSNDVADILLEFIESNPTYSDNLQTF